jgi:sec-independent protein translocase protein TatA
MFQGIGLPELLVILVIVLLVFGVGRVSRVGGELGKGIRAFREGLSGKDEQTSDTAKDSSQDSGSKPAP